MGQAARTCGARSSGVVSLPVLGGGPGPRKSRNGPRRAVVLALLHVVMGVHVLLWLAFGMTVSPIEPSETMYTLNRGEVNAGFVFFATAIAATFVFGRFVCGWGCHIVALQDLCAWAMRRVRIRPKPFRSRLLVLAPLALAIYMFIWPTFHREVLTPGLRWVGVGVPAWLGESGPRPEFHAAFIVRDFWATFPPWYVAAPFLAVCGFATVYFLGSKGFCTYGCPYGGFFGPADLVSAGRILVNDDCEQCGHCTAACTSNVRVHEEVRDFGMVVDPGCMKCLDCVSVCPNNALRFGFAMPPVLNARARRGTRRSRPSYDLTLRQEASIAAVGVVLFLGFRGMFDLVPMLMAMGLASIGAFAAWKLVAMTRIPNVRLQNLQLRYRGRLTAAGWVFIPSALLLLSAGGWGGMVRYHLWRGAMLDGAVPIPAAQYLAPDYKAPAGVAATAREAIRHLELADAPTRGGMGWTLNPDASLKLASLHAILGRFDRAAERLDRVVRAREPSEELLVYYVQVLLRSGATPQRAAEAITPFSTSGGALAILAGIEAGRRNTSEALTLAREAMSKGIGRVDGLVVVGGLLVEAGEYEAAVSAYRRATELNPKSGALRAHLGLGLFAAGRPEEGLAVIDEGVGIEPENPSLRRLKAEMLSSMGRTDEAERERARAVELELHRGGP
jgi:polyferredoxin/tetratricopeptide (TPR) repeat protein